MIRHNPVIAGVLLFDMFALLMYNFSGMCVTGKGPCCCHVSRQSSNVRRGY
jgi:hypothetical protein